MKPVMYLFANKGLGMSPGKLGAQVAHAAVEAFRISIAPDPTWPITAPLEGEAYRKWIETPLVREWYKGGHYTKLVMQASNTTHLLAIERYIEARGFKTALIIDEGRTEIAPHTPTALGVEIVNKDDEHTNMCFKSFEIYREEKKRKKGL